MTDQPDTERDPAYEEGVEQIVAYLKANPGATLRGRHFDVSRDEGKREFAEWLMETLWELNDWLDAEEAKRREEVRAFVVAAEEARPEFEQDERMGGLSE